MFMVRETPLNGKYHEGGVQKFPYFIFITSLLKTTSHIQVDGSPCCLVFSHHYMTDHHVLGAYYI